MPFLPLFWNVENCPTDQLSHVWFSISGKESKSFWRGWGVCKKRWVRHNYASRRQIPGKFSVFDATAQKLVSWNRTPLKFETSEATPPRFRSFGTSPPPKKKLRDVLQEREGTSLNYIEQFSQSILLYLALSWFISVSFGLSLSLSVHLGASQCILVYLGMSQSISD